MHQLTRSEAALLTAETNTNFGHQSLCLELAPDADGNHLSLSTLRAVIQESLHLAPSLRRRVLQVPLGLDDPWWIDDPHFDLDYHLRHLAVPGASDPDALEQLLARLHERPLDRNRPLWELYLIENPDGASTLYVKVHIVLVEELGPLGPLSPVLARPELDLDGTQHRPWRADMVPSDADLLIKAGWALGRRPTRAARQVLQAVRQLPVLGDVARLMLTASDSTRHPVEQARNDRPVPRVSFNRTVSAHRRVARVTLSVDKLREVRRERDVRFHDVLLAVIGGAVRHLMVVNDELPSEPLVALTPLLVDAESDELGAALVPIATHRHDPLQRLEDISQSMSELTLDLEPQSVETITKRKSAPTALAGAASRLLLTAGAGLRLMPPFNIYVVNIPGRDEGPIAGHAVEYEHVMCPIIDGIGLSVSAISHDHRVDVTLVADRDLVPNLEVLADRLETELELLHHACANARPSRRPRVRSRNKAKENASASA